MNREQRRLLKRKGKAKEYMNNLVNKFLSKDTAPFMREGTKVRLNYEKIIGDTDYPRKVERYKQFVESNRGAVFTVEYDPRHTNRPSLVCLAEDPSEVKWLWFTGDLEVVK